MEADLYELLQPGTAKANEQRAYEIVSKRVDDPGSWQLFQISAYGNPAVERRFVEGISDRWTYGYVSDSGGIITVQLSALEYFI